MNEKRLTEIMRFPLTGTLRTFTFKNNVRAGRTGQVIFTEK